MDIFRENIPKVTALIWLWTYFKGDEVIAEGELDILIENIPKVKALIWLLKC
jgi:hypothetical protein